MGRGGPRALPGDHRRGRPQARWLDLYERLAASSAAVERIAVIDMGSNSFRLVVFGCEPGSWWSLSDEIREAPA